MQHYTANKTADEFVHTPGVGRWIRPAASFPTSPTGQLGSSNSQILLSFQERVLLNLNSMPHFGGEGTRTHIKTILGLTHLTSGAEADDMAYQGSARERVMECVESISASQNPRPFTQLGSFSLASHSLR